MSGERILETTSGRKIFVYLETNYLMFASNDNNRFSISRHNVIDIIMKKITWIWVGNFLVIMYLRKMTKSRYPLILRIYYLWSIIISLKFHMFARLEHLSYRTPINCNVINYIRTIIKSKHTVFNTHYTNGNQK